MPDFGKWLSETPDDPETDDFIYVLLPCDIDPQDRTELYGDVIDAELKLAGIGYVSGGGTMLSEEQPDGGRSVEFCGVDVETSDTDAARLILREQLPMLGCPDGTELHFTKLGVTLRDAFLGGEWHLNRPRTQLHPGFGF